MALVVAEAAGQAADAPESETLCHNKLATAHGPQEAMA